MHSLEDKLDRLLVSFKDAKVRIHAELLQNVSHWYDRLRCSNGRTLYMML